MTKRAFDKIAAGLVNACEWTRGYVTAKNEAAAEIARLTDALQRIALLDEADGHELKERHAFEAVAIATATLGKHPSEIYADRRRYEQTAGQATQEGE